MWVWMQGVRRKGSGLRGQSVWRVRRAGFVRVGSECGPVLGFGALRNGLRLHGVRLRKRVAVRLGRFRMCVR